MSEQTTSSQSSEFAGEPAKAVEGRTAASDAECCITSASAPGSPQSGTQTEPCCDTASETSTDGACCEADGTCCGADAKAEAVASGVACC